MQKASNALKTTSKSHGKKSKEAAASGKGGAGGSARAKGEASRARPQQPETPAEPSPAVTPMDTEEPVLLEPEGGVQNEEHGATSLREGVSTDIATVEEKDHEEHAVEVEKTILEEPEAVKEAAPAPEPQLQEEKPQSSAVAETEAKSQENAAQHSTHAQAQHSTHAQAQHAHSTHIANGKKT
jgi:hypothetical protein